MEATDEQPRKRVKTLSSPSKDVELEQEVTDVDRARTRAEDLQRIQMFDSLEEVQAELEAVSGGKC